MRTALSMHLTPDDQAAARAEIRRKEQQDRYDRRLSEQVDRIEREVRALKVLIGEDEEPPANEGTSRDAH